jgi:Holliday junction DNA helicase RuvA
LAQDDALAALEALGYKSRDALSAINALPERDALSAEDMIRQALKRLAR